MPRATAMPRAAAAGAVRVVGVLGLVLRIFEFMPGENHGLPESLIGLGRWLGDGEAMVRQWLGNG